MATIPERMMPGIRLYIDEGIIPGSFLQAVICNDLREAVGCADDENLENLPAFVRYFYNEAPAACWGSKDKMYAWSETKMNARGMRKDQRIEELIDLIRKETERHARSQND